MYSAMRRRQRGGKCPTSPHRAGGEEAVVSFNLLNPNPKEGRSSHGAKAEDDPRKKGTRKKGKIKIKMEHKKGRRKKREKRM